MTEPIRVGAERVVYAFSPDDAPAVEVEPGATVLIETRDAYDRQFASHRDIDRYRRERSARRSNPATGPIAVRGARPGDGLSVTIEAIALGTTGYVAAIPGIGVLGDTAIEPRIAAFEVRPDGLWFDGRLRLPLRPMIGVIGVAPVGGAIPCLQLGYHGGNLDFNDITVGTTVHLPVNAPGGLLALGDVHAGMGFCEVHSGVNIDAEVRLRVDLAPAAGWERPWFETATELMTIGVEDRLEEAIRQATLGMTALLQRRLGLSHTDAVMVAGAAVDIRLGQAANFGVSVSAYAACPKAIFAA
jgi:amidase